MANENQDNKNPSQSKPAFWTLSNSIVAFVVCAAVTAPFWYPLLVRRIMMNQFFEEFSTFSWEKYGQFGDSFGYLTAAFTAGAFYLLWKTYNAQKKELRETRESIERGRLQNTFFSILKACENANANARYDYCSEKEGKITYKGTSAIYYAVASRQGEDEGALAVRLMDDFGNLFRITIVLLCVVSDMPPEMRPNYIKIIDAWLSPAERIMMALISNQFYQQHEDLRVGEVVNEIMRPLVGKYLFLAGTQKDRKDQFQAVRDVIAVAKEYGDKI